MQRRRSSSERSKKDDASPSRRHEVTFQNAHQDLITHVSMDSTGRRMATTSSDKTMAVWQRTETGDWTRIATWKVHGGAVWRSAWAHPEFGQIIATCSCDRSVHIWEQVRDDMGGKYGKWIRRKCLTDSRNAVTDVAFAPRHLGLQLVTVSTQGFVRIYEAADTMDLTRWTMIHELKAFHWRCSVAAWSLSPIHLPLVVVGSDETKEIAKNPMERLVVYELNETSRKFQRITALKLELPLPVTDIQFNPLMSAEHHQIAIAAGDIFIYNFKVPAQSFLDEDGTYEPITTDREYTPIKVAQLNMGDIKNSWRIRFNLTGNVLVASSGDGTVRVFKSLFVNQWVPLTDMPAATYLQETEEEHVRPRGYLAEEGRGFVKEPYVYY